MLSFKTCGAASQCNPLLKKTQLMFPEKQRWKIYTHTHNEIFFDSPSSSSPASIQQSWRFQTTLFWQTPFSLSVMQHMVDIMRFECVQEMKRIYHLQFVLGKYLLFPEPSRVVSDHGWPRCIPHGATASVWQGRLHGCTGVGKQTRVHVSCIYDKTTARNNQQSKPQSPQQSK